MRYSLEPNYRRYVEGYGRKLMNSATKTGINAAEKSGDKYGQNLKDTAKKKQGTNFAKTAGKKNSSKKCRSYWRFGWK